MRKIMILLISLSFINLLFLSFYVQATGDTYNVATGNDDKYYHSTTGYVYDTETIFASINKEISPETSDTAYADVDTSAIPDDNVISSASVKFDEYSYYASRGLAKTYVLYMWDGSGWQNIQEYTFGRSAVTRTKVLNSTQIGWINKTGKTKFSWGISGTVGDGQSKSFQLKAYETSQAVACRMEITHAPAPSDSCSDCNGTSDCVIQCSDYCNLSSTINMNNHKIHFNGTGSSSSNMHIL